jgi:hypothetical protein
VVQSVAETKGRTPKLASANLGAQRSPNKNSTTETSLKKSIEGSSKAMMMPIVVRTDTPAATAKPPRTNP